MPFAITLTTATLGGQQQAVTTIGFADQTAYRDIVPVERDAFYYHDGQRFTRCMPTLKYKAYQELPERGPLFSSLLHGARWKALLDFEQRQFGAFKSGDLLRISEAYHPTSRNVSMRTPLFHSDRNEETTHDKFSDEAHAYVVAGQHRALNTEVPAAPLPPLPYHILKLLDNSGTMGRDHAVADWLAAHGGTRHLAPFEIAILPLRLPHRSSQNWGSLALEDQEFGRMKVLRATMPRFALRHSPV